MTNDSNSKKSKLISLGTLGSIKVTLLDSELPEIYAKYPSTSTTLCGNGIDYRGLGGANLNDDAACPAMS